MTIDKVTVRTVTYPAIGRPTEPRPELPAAVFEKRLARARERMSAHGLDALVVYGDREHFATLHYLTNYDPRFEESLLVILPEGTPVLLVGNEGMGYSQVARLPVERRLYQTFSLLGQPRDRVEPLDAILRRAGLDGCRRVGTAGWKYFSQREFADAEERLDLPEFIAFSLRRAVPAPGRVVNVTALFMDPEDGLRNRNEPEQIADFEWLATHNSENLLDGLRGLRPGMTEMEVFAKMPFMGLPLCTHAQCASGENILRYGMPSPTSRVIREGDPLMLTFSYLGANTCRFGWVARDERDLPAAVRDYVERVAKPYASALGAWLRAFRIGATGDELHHAVTDLLVPRGITLGLNCGHQIAYDEWTHSMVYAGSTARAGSGMYWQADFFAVTGTPHHGAFAEDGYALADAPLRDELARRYPAMWRRVQARRAFMRGELGLAPAEEVLPFSNCAGAVMPFLLSPSSSLAVEGGKSA